MEIILTAVVRSHLVSAIVSTAAFVVSTAAFVVTTAVFDVTMPAAASMTAA